MQFDKQFVINELEKQGKSEHVQHALDQLPEKIDHNQHAALLEKFELPEKIDHNQHAALLEKFGLDPGQLAEKAAKEGLTKL